MLHASACAMPGALLEFAIQSLCRWLVVRCVRFGYPRSGKFLGVGLVATIVVTVIVRRLARKALKKTGATKQGHED